MTPKLLYPKTRKLKIKKKNTFKNDVWNCNYNAIKTEMRITITERTAKADPGSRSVDGTITPRLEQNQ